MDEESESESRKHYSKARSALGLLWRKNWMLSIALLVLSYLSMIGVTERTVGKILMIERVYTVNQDFLNRSLATAMGHFTALSVAKGGLAAVANTAPFGIAVGKVVSPISDTVDFLWKVFAYSMVSITLQMALLKFFKLVAVKVLLASGAFLCALSFNLLKVLKRVGIALMFCGIILYAAAPCGIYVGRILFENNDSTANQMLSENLEWFKDQVSSVKLATVGKRDPSTAKKAIYTIIAKLSDGLDGVIRSLVRYFTNLVIMFVITPLFFYGLIYLLMQKSLEYIGMSSITIKLDEGFIRMLKKM